MRISDWRSTCALPIFVVTVSLDGDGRPMYAVSRDGTPVITDSRLGFLFTDAPKMERYFKVIDARTAASDTRWDQPWGEWKTIRDNHTELTVRLREAKDLEIGRASCRERVCQYV